MIPREFKSCASAAEIKSKQYILCIKQLHIRSRRNSHSRWNSAVVIHNSRLYSVNYYIAKSPIQDCTRVKSCFYFSLLSREAKPQDIFWFTSNSRPPTLLVNDKGKVDPTLGLVAENILLGVAGSCHRGYKSPIWRHDPHKSSHPETLKRGNQDSIVVDFYHNHNARGSGSSCKPRQGACLLMVALVIDVNLQLGTGFR